MKSKFTLTLSVLLFVIPGFVGANPDADDVEFLSGLRERRLFSLAVQYCNERLVDTSLSTPQRIRLAIELSQTYAMQAVHSQPRDRPQLWDASRQAINVLRPDVAHDPRFVLAGVQHALVALAQGELARQEIALVSQADPNQPSARIVLRRAIQELESVQNEIGQQLRGVRKRDGLSETELLQLKNNIQFQLARAFRNQGLSYPPASADRIHALTQAVQQLGPLTQLPNDQPIAWSSRIDRITCYRLLADTKLANQAVDALLRESPPIDVRLRAQAEQIRVALQDERIEPVLAFIENLPASAPGQNAELDLSILEAFIAAWSFAQTRSAERELWQNRIAVQLNELEERHGTYWKRRGASLLTRVAGEGIAAGNIDLLVQTAQNFYASGQWPEAIASFDRAAAKARQSGDADRSFRLGFTSAKVEREHGRPSVASERFRILATDHRAHPRAGDAHLAAVVMAARKAGEAASSGTQEYVALLHEHLELWPHARSADTARWWLGRLHEHRREWNDAVHTYRGISMDFERHATAIQATARCWRKVCDALMPDSEQRRAEAAGAVSSFERIVVGEDDNLPERWSEAARVAALEAVRFRLWFLDQGFERAESLLVAALRSNDGATDDWISSAQVLLVTLYARQGKTSAALEILRQIAGVNPMELVDLLESISRFAQEANTNARPDFAGLQLATLSKLSPRKDELTASQQRWTRRMQADALAATGRRQEALEILEALSAANPRDGMAQEAFAQLLLDGNDHDSMLRAIDQWRSVGRRSRSGSRRWYQSKYSLAMAHYRLGNRRRAAAIIRLVQAVPPGLAGTPLKAKLERLLEQSEAPNELQDEEQNRHSRSAAP